MSTESIFRHDPRNRFEVANANRAAQLRKDIDDAAQRRAEASRQRDAKSARPRTASGILLDAKTLEAKRDRDDDLAAGLAERTAPQHPPLSPATMEAVSASWAAMTPAFYPSEFNRRSLVNWVRMNVERNGATFGIELLDAGFRWLGENNHLERDPSIVRKRGDVVSDPSPTIFEYEPVEERQAREQLARDVAQSIEESEGQRAKALPFAELQREIRSSRKPLTRPMADAVVR